MEHQAMSDLVERVREICLERALAVSAENVTQIVRELQPLMSPSQRLETVNGILAQFTGLGVLDELLLIQGVTDILVNSHSEIWIDKGQGTQRVATTLRNIVH
jgi:pilus assembly protein CpaF